MKIAESFLSLLSLYSVSESPLFVLKVFIGLSVILCIEPIHFPGLDLRKLF